MKVYRDLGEMKSNVDYKSEYKSLMEEIPNYNKAPGAKKIYQRKNFIILKASDNFIVYNTKKQFEEGHTHTNNFNYAKSLIDLSIRKKLPQRPNKRIIQSLIRLGNDSKYIEKLRNCNNHQSI